MANGARLKLAEALPNADEPAPRLASPPEHVDHTALADQAAAPDPSPGAAAGPESGPVAELLARRERLLAEFRRLDEVSVRLAEAEFALSEIDSSTKALEGAETDEYRAWAESGNGPAPQPMLEARELLAQRRLSAQCAVDAARAAMAGIQPRLNSLRAELERINLDLLEHRLQTATEQARQLHAEAGDIAAKLAGPMTAVIALRNLCRIEVDAAIGKRDERRAALFGQAFECVADLQPPIVMSDAESIAREVERWRADIL